MYIRIAAVCLLLLFPASILAGCEQDLAPEQIFERYLSEWRNQQYDRMYTLLSGTAKNVITREEFAKKYSSIYEGIGISELSIQIISADKPAGKDLKEVKIPFHVQMNTMAGPIAFKHEAKLVKSKGGTQDGWEVEWNPSLIFPSMGEGDKVRYETRQAVRGEITDRHGNGLAVNETMLQIGLVPGQLGDHAEQTKSSLSRKSGIPIGELNNKLSAVWVKSDSFVPLFVAEKDELADYKKLPGVKYQNITIRTYPYKEAAAHLTGYIAPINEEELKKNKNYSSDDRIGKTGLEQIYEARLRGQNGARIFIVNAAGQEKMTLASKETVPGENIQLSLDADLQQTIYEQMKRDAGSAAAIHPRSGEVLALVSTPSFDPNLFVRGVPAAVYKQWSDDPDKPLLNRFTKGYSPGSGFKLLTAAMGIDQGILRPEATKTIHGLRWTKDASWGNYYVTRVHDVREVNLQQAITYSDNIYFAQTALDMGKERFMEMSGDFGIGEKIPLTYPFEPSRLYNKEISNEIQLADSGYGQGEVTMTSLHIAIIYSAIVNQGNIHSPTLLKEDLDKQKLWKRAVMKPDTAELLQKILIQAVQDPAGVGHGAFIKGKQIAGKTGTSELKKRKGEIGQENGWFIGFDAANPDLMVAVMIENVKERGGSNYVTSKVKSVFQ
ncbi:penicillin-binding transpeptidase domain-containing protein [Paenibacillus sp. FJAT-26967]|uniref:penicillin-binding transpeptidase domain-containing protein n=1 Tax=Paenibacillus sp. FJAT-26967 TaxID=1729690 RepID=UPI000838ED89|nr:penicillin-binding transpeptidase domain-containing protein [Paenibacillus sp. FJAT-26967]